MSVTFNGATKIIQVDTGIETIDVRDVYSRWKDWVLLSDNAKWAKAFRVSGGDPIGGGAIAPIYFFLMNGWTIKPDDTSGNHTLKVSLNLYSDPETNALFTDVAGVAVNNVRSDSPGVDTQAIRDAMAKALTTGTTVESGSIDDKIKDASLLIPVD